MRNGQILNQCTAVFPGPENDPGPETQLCIDSKFGHFSRWPYLVRWAPNMAISGFDLIRLCGGQYLDAPAELNSENVPSKMQWNFHMLEFIFYIIHFLKRFPIFWSNTCLRKCIKFSMDFIPFSQLFWIMKYWATKNEQYKLPLKCIQVSVCSNLLFKQFTF